VHFPTLGPVPLSSDKYVPREFSDDLIRQVLRGNWILLLGPRQHGKTSALIRVKKTIVEEGIKTAFVDLQNLPPLENYEQLVTWFVRKVGRQFDCPDVDDVVSDDVSEGIAQVTPAGNEQIVVIIDEASNIANEEWRNSFFGQIRGISSERAHAPDGSVAKRICFVFSGTFRPESLIATANSPFNVCERIETNDLDRAAILGLAKKQFADDVANEIATLIEAEVGGQPYLVQRAMASISESEVPLTALRLYIEKIKVGDTSHFTDLFGKVIGDPKLKEIVSSMSQNGAVQNEPIDDDFKFLQILGIAKRNGANLDFRYPIYRHVASVSPQLNNNIPIGVTTAPLHKLNSQYFAKIQDPHRNEFVTKAYDGAIAAFNVGSNRICLSAFGAALEAILLDYYAQQPPADIAAAVTSLNRSQHIQIHFQRNEQQNNPDTWRLVNLVKVADQMSGRNPIECPNALRDWRNFIHPDVALTNYHTDEHYAPEARVAANLIEMILRDM